MNQNQRRIVDVQTFLETGTPGCKKIKFQITTSPWNQRPPKSFIFVLGHTICIKKP
jgi:hypothetical protein